MPGGPGRYGFEVIKYYVILAEVNRKDVLNVFVKLTFSDGFPEVNTPITMVDQTNTPFPESDLKRKCNLGLRATY